MTRRVNEAELLAQAKAAARQRLAAALGQAGGHVRDGAGQVGSLVQRHPYISMGAAFVAGFTAVKLGQRVVHAFIAHRAPPSPDAVTPADQPSHGWLRR